MDTHLFAWMASGWRDLTSFERSAIEQAQGDLLVSVISLWELRLKWRSNPRRASAEGLITPTHAIVVAAAHAIDIAPFTADIATHALDPPLAHKDPFDEVLLVHAQQLGAKLLTRDPDMVGHPLAYQP